MDFSWKNHVVMEIHIMTNSSEVEMTTSNQRTLLHIVIFIHIHMTKYSNNNEGLRDVPKRGPQIPWETRHREQKLSDMTVVILSGATGPT